MMSATKTMVILSLATACLLTADAASAASCESLRALALPHTTIASAAAVPAGPFQAPRTAAPPAVILPAHCRVAAVLAPSGDSRIQVEGWVPAEKWNGKFQAIGNGGWAGALTLRGA